MTAIVVVGAGVGGLAAAARLAAAGHEVTVVERAATVGGKLGQAEWDLPQGRFRFDTGPGLLTLPHLLTELFAATGGQPADALQLERLDPVCRYRFGAGTGFDAPADVDRFADEAARALGPGAGEDWRRLAARARRIWEATEGPFLRSPIDGPADVVRLARAVRDIPTIAPWRTLRSLGDSSLRAERLRMFLDRYATYSGSDPRRAPGVLATIPYLEQTYGGWYVRGGLRRIADALLARCRERGVTVVTGSAVTRIGVVGGRVGHVDLADGQRLRAGIVVANADAATVYARLLPEQAPGVAGMRRRIAAAPPSLSGFVLLLALRGTTPALAHHTVLFPADRAAYDREFDAVFGGRTAGDPTVLVTCPADPSARPDGHEAWFVLVNASRQGAGADPAGADPAGADPATLDWDVPGRAEAYADHVLDVLARRGLDVRHRVLRREVITPADLERATGAPGGAIYGTSGNSRRAAFLRPANRGSVPGLFLVGGSAHPGGGVPLVLIGAEIVAGLIGPAR